MHVWRQFYFKSRLLRCGPKPKQQINEKKKPSWIKLLASYFFSKCPSLSPILKLKFEREHQNILSIYEGEWSKRSRGWLARWIAS